MGRGGNYLEGRKHPKFTVGQACHCHGSSVPSVDTIGPFMGVATLLRGMSRILKIRTMRQNGTASLYSDLRDPRVHSTPTAFTKSLSNKLFNPLRSRDYLCQRLKKLRRGLSAVAISLQTWRTLSWQSLLPDQVPD